MTSRDLLRLKKVHPELVTQVTEILVEMERLGHPMFVVQGARTADEQHKLWLQGRAGNSGKIVTYKDGYKHRSDHQLRSDGLGYAADLAFQDSEPFSEEHPWERYGELVESHNLMWGGRWKMVDRPHVELDEEDV